MKILVLSNKLPYPPRDGGSIATLNMLTGLRDAGNKVTCLSLNTRKHAFPVEQIPGALRGSIRYEAVDCDTSVRPLPMLLNLLFSGKPYIAERFRLGEYTGKLGDVLQQEQYDVIQLEGPYMGHYLDVIRSGSGAAVSLRAHNVEHLIWKRKAAVEAGPLRRWYLGNMAARLEKFEMQVLQQSDCLVAISDVDAACFRSAGYNGPVITIPTGLRPDQYPVTPLPPGPTIFFIGALDWLPNQEGLEWFLEKVFTKLTGVVPGLSFHVAGRNAPRKFIRKLAHRQVVFHGEVEDAISFMQAYRVMVAPLLTGSGIRIKILEAMALGRPVVTTPVGIEGIPAEHGREAMVAEDPDNFADQVVALFNKDQEAVRMVQLARHLVQQNFDTFTLSTRLSRFFKVQV
ncbi:MAG TPA: glycosyltransferase [Bacteroides sp.]|nr:glycosyltransferase [Bacteroides sp.]